MIWHDLMGALIFESCYVVSEFDQCLQYTSLSESRVNSVSLDDQIIVVDIRTGELISKVSVGSPLANGMFLSPGFERDIYYCSTLTFARVQWR